MKLYQTLSEKQLKNFLNKQGISFDDLQLTEIMNSDKDLFGDFIEIPGYKFKKIYSEYSCMETPTEKHCKIKPLWPKAPGDYYKPGSDR